LLQVNFRVPANAPLGDAIPIYLTAGDARSPDGVTMAIRSPVKQVLVVDSELATRTSLRNVLVRAGYEAFTAQNGREAMAQAAEHAIDLVISKLALPDDDWAEAVGAMRARRPQLRIVATARTLDPATLRQADLFGAQAILVRPMATQMMLRRIREVLRVRPVQYVADEDLPAMAPIYRSPH
jgi:DNA-binding NarL/FixJ family response regulator